MTKKPIDIKRAAFINERVKKLQPALLAAPTDADKLLVGEVFMPFVAYVAGCRYDMADIDTTTDAVVNLVSGMIMELVVNTQPKNVGEGAVKSVAQTIIDEVAESLTNALEQTYGNKPATH